MTSDHPRQDSHATLDQAALDEVAFDDAARRAHAASLDRLSPRVRAQLAQRRRAAIQQDTRPAPVRVWPMLALGSAAALTLAVGLFVVRGTGDSGTSKTPDTVVTAPVPGIDTAPHTSTATADPEPAAHTTSAPVIASTDTPDTTVGDSAIIEVDPLPTELLAAEFDTADEAMGFDTSQESPDFYLWLGSEESQIDVTESL
ncbi:MAG: hypothetical protein ABL934_05195 [Lysobacteraceae bacterium]